MGIPRTMRGVGAVLVALALSISSSSIASANDPWCGQCAAIYADFYWNDCTVLGLGGIPAPNTLSSDGFRCASRAMNSWGSFTMVNAHSSSQWNSWWIDKWAPLGSHSLSWAGSAELYHFLVYEDHDNGASGPGGGWLFATTTGAYKSQLYNSLSKGDLIFMALDGGGYSNIDHVRIEAGWDSNGDYADQHSPGRKHSFWNGAYENPNPDRVVIFQVHIDAANI
jgi:hypothetical protein